MTCQQCDSKFHIRCSDTEFNTSKANENKNIHEICSQCKLKNKKCGKCNKLIGKNHRYINCSKCSRNVHLKCNETDENTYNQLKSDQSILLILTVNQIIFPFTT